MLIVFPLESLRRAHSLVSPFRAGPRSPVPLRQSLRVEVNAANQVFLAAAADSATSARAQVFGAEVRQRGAGMGLLPGARTLKLSDESTVTRDTFRRLLDCADGECLTLSFTGGDATPTLIVRGGARNDAVWTMPVAKAADWPTPPDLPGLESAVGVARAGQLAAALRIASAFVGQAVDGMQDFRGAVHLLSVGERLDVVGADSGRLAVATIPWDRRRPTGQRADTGPADLIAALERSRGECSARRLVAALSHVDPLEEVTIRVAGSRLRIECASIQIVEAEAGRRMPSKWRKAIDGFGERGFGEATVNGRRLASAWRLFADEDDDMRFTLDATALQVASEAGESFLVDAETGDRVAIHGDYRAARSWQTGAHWRPLLDAAGEEPLTLAFTAEEFARVTWSREGLAGQAILGPIDAPGAARMNKREQEERRRLLV